MFLTSPQCGLYQRSGLCNIKPNTWGEADALHWLTVTNTAQSVWIRRQKLPPLTKGRRKRERRDKRNLCAAAGRTNIKMLKTMRHAVWWFPMSHIMSVVCVEWNKSRNKKHKVEKSVKSVVKHALKLVLPFYEYLFYKTKAYGINFLMVVCRFTVSK